MLVRTYERMPVDRWDAALAGLRARDRSNAWPTCGVLLVGIDTASIDPADSKTLDATR